MYISISEIKKATFFCILRNVTWYILIIVCLFLMLDVDVEMYKNIVVIVILIPLIISCFLYMRKYVVYHMRESYLREKGIRIEAKINRKDFRMSTDNQFHYCYFVAYYAEDTKTYVFRDKMILANVVMDLELGKIKREGIFPDKISVLVAPDDYNKYIILKYNFINKLYELNSDIVETYIK